MSRHLKKVRIQPQPDDSSCGPTSLHAVYDLLGEKITLKQTLKEVSRLKDGGTLAVHLAIHALSRGLRARIHSTNLQTFDPSWNGLGPQELIDKLLAQLKYKKSKKLREATHAYVDLLRNGGEIILEDITENTLLKYWKEGHVILAGLSATYLYRSKREYTDENDRSIYDDLRGRPMGHFVVLCGMEEGKVLVADPYPGNPISNGLYYRVGVPRLINSIMQGIVTYDANLLIISRHT